MHTPPPTPHTRSFPLRNITRGLVASMIMLSASTHADPGGRLLATGGVTQIEGSAGGGLVPWALIAGYGTRDQIGATAFHTEVRTSDFTLASTGAAVGIYDRTEISYARQRFGLGNTVNNTHIDQDILGIKVKLYGDAVYSQDSVWPQIAAGAQYKKNDNYSPIPQALGAKHDSGTDFYVAATKVYLAGPLGRNWLVNGTVRASKANQYGLLGFGGDLNDSYRANVEASAGVFLTDHVVRGAEYRHKNNNLSSFREQSAQDIWLAWMPNKWLSITAAYVDLGSIANKSSQTGSYLSMQINF